MLPEHRKSIRAANIYYKMAAGRRGSDVGETRERAGEDTSRPTTPVLEKLVQTLGELIRI